MHAKGYRLIDPPRAMHGAKYMSHLQHCLSVVLIIETQIKYNFDCALQMRSFSKLKIFRSDKLNGIIMQALSTNSEI